MGVDRRTWWVVAAIGLLAIGKPCRAGGYRTIAKEFSREARKSGVRRVAVLPFTPTDGSARDDGWNISERIITQLVRRGKLQTVERGMLNQVLEEQSLARTGLIAPETLKSLGRVLAVDALLTGTFVIMGREVIVNARLVHVETGVIIAAAEEAAVRDWFDARTDSLFDPVPVAEAAEPVDCESAAEHVDAIERSILDTKARYWAFQIKHGASHARIRDSPGATIRDPVLRGELYELMRRHLQTGDFHLTPAEVKRFIVADERAFRLQHDCGL